MYEVLLNEAVSNDIYHYFNWSDGEVIQECVWKREFERLFGTQRYKGPHYHKMLLAIINKNLRFVKWSMWSRIEKPLLKDRGFVSKALDINLNVFPYIDFSFKNNKSIMLKVINLGYISVKYVKQCDILKTDDEIIRAALKRCTTYIQYVPESYKKDKVLAKTILTEDGKCLEFFDISIKSDKELVIIAVNNWPWAVRYMAPVLRYDKEFILELVKMHDVGLQFADESLKNDKLFISKVVSINGLALQYASPALRADSDIVLIAIENCRWSLQYADPVLKDNEMLVSTATRGNFEIIKYASKRIRKLTGYSW